MMKKKELKEILKKNKKMHGCNLSGLSKKQLLYIFNKIQGGCNNPESPLCPKNILKRILYSNNYMN